MPGGVVITGTADTSRVEAPVTVRAYLLCGKSCDDESLRRDENED